MVKNPKKTNRPQLALPIVLMAWPAAVFSTVLFLYATTNFFTLGLFGLDEENVIQQAINAFLFLIGVISVTAGPASFLAGLILLVLRLAEWQKKSSHK